jgi:polysaccharide biosynthesis/export protein VpsN
MIPFAPARERRQGRDLGHAMKRNALASAISAGVLFFPAAPPALAGGRVLTTSDVVSIRVVDEPDLDMTTRVEPDGTINFPYVGRIKAAGRTEDQLERAIERRLVELKILAHP